MVPTNALSKKTLIECAVISSSASKTSFYFRENPMECIVEEEERVYLSGPFESEFIRFVTVRKGVYKWMQLDIFGVRLDVSITHAIM